MTDGFDKLLCYLHENYSYCLKDYYDKNIPIGPNEICEAVIGLLKYIEVYT